MMPASTAVIQVQCHTSGSCSSSSIHASTTGSDGSENAVVLTVAEPSVHGAKFSIQSIYDLYTRRRMYCIMLVVALSAVTVPLSNTIFLPAMKAIQQELHTSTTAVTASVATFQVAVGLGALLWGPASDKYGRKPILLVATVLFVITNVPIILAQNIAVLLAFRTLQGAAIGAYASVGSGMAADICSPAHRGTLFGICSVAALLGPVIGPPLGGGLSQAFGWRSMFIFMAVLAAAVLLPLLVCCVPETLQYKVLQKLCRTHPDVAANIQEGQEIRGQGPPKFQAPWYPLSILMDRRVVLHTAVCLVGFATYICSITELPIFLSKPPYNMSTSAIGATFLPGACAAILASPAGGKLADSAGRSHPQQPLRRLIYTNLLLLLLMPLSLLVFGWGLQKGVHLVAVLVALFLVAAVNALYMPGLFTVMTIIKQQAAAAATGGVYAAMFLLSGVFTIAGTSVIALVGLGPVLTALAVIHFCITLAAFVHIVQSCSVQQLPEPLTSQKGSRHFALSAYQLVARSFKEGKVAHVVCSSIVAPHRSCESCKGNCSSQATADLTCESVCGNEPAVAAAAPPPTKAGQEAVNDSRIQV